MSIPNPQLCGTASARLTDLKNRGHKDIFVACNDGMTGFAEALCAAYPDLKVQLCTCTWCTLRSSMLRTNTVIRSWLT